MAEAAAGGLYYCHMCASTVSAVAAAEGEVEIKCPYCHNGFVEEMESARGAAVGGGRGDGAGSSGGDGAISSVWAPMIDGMVGGDPVRRHRRSRRLAEASTDDGYYRDLALLDFSESRRRTAALLLLMQEFRERQLQRLESATAAASASASANAAAGSGSPDVEGVALADYFLGPGLDALMQRLGDGDAGRQGTLPAKKEAVEAMPTVEVTAGDSASACAVCLEDYAAGERATEMPCRHRFHAKCIVPWLKMHSSCPVCRFQLPTEDDDDPKSARGGGGGAHTGVSTRRLSQPAQRVDRGGQGRLPAVMQELRSILSQPGPSPSSAPASTSGSSSHSQQHRDD